MKVILLRDVAKLGRRMEVVTVPDGYGLNKLIPQSLALPATPENIKRVESQTKKASADRAADTANFLDVVKALEGKVIDIKAEANEDGKLYRAVKTEELAEAVNQAESVTISAHDLIVKTPIKHTGEHKIEMVHGESTGAFTINVVKS